MEWSIVWLLALAALAWLWYDSMRARERAVAAGQNACARERLQFLDETVECTSIRAVRCRRGPAESRCIRRRQPEARRQHRDALRRGRIADDGAFPAAVSPAAV